MVQLSGAPVPLILQVTPPPVLVGAVAAVPEIATLNVIVEPNEPPPELERSAVGVTFEIMTLVGAVAARAV